MILSTQQVKKDSVPPIVQGIVMAGSKPSLPKQNAFADLNKRQPPNLFIGGGGNECTTEASSTVDKQPKEEIFAEADKDIFGSSSSEDDSGMDEESPRKVICGEDLFRDLFAAAFQQWLDNNADEIMDRIAENHVLQPRKKKAKVSKK